MHKSQPENNVSRPACPEQPACLTTRFARAARPFSNLK